MKKKENSADLGSNLTLNFGKLFEVMEEPQLVGIAYHPWRWGFYYITTFQENIKPGTIAVYFATSDVATTHKELSGKRVKVNEAKDDLFGPGSGVKWFNLEYPDGNQVHLVQA